MKKKIAIIGLGYVGLPLAVEFGKKRDVVGFDISELRIDELKNKYDSTLEIDSDDFDQAVYLNFSSNPDDLKNCEIFIITVPTPIDSYKNPDLLPLKAASQTIGKILKKGDIVIYESTVFPGATEEVCVPILERHSNLIFNQDFFCGYSPERINPGDKEHKLTNIKKVTSGSTPEILEEIDDLYSEIIKEGTYKASSIKVAEAAKIIENTQRDINIALINELSIIFNKLGIDTNSVLEAAATKWNFVPFKPGLVGGHCIGVDPYYLTYKSLEVGYTPEIILAGRRLNDSMGEYIVNQVFELMKKKNIDILDSKVLIMGLAFKENCPDIRNTRVVDMITKFKENKCNVDIYDPWVDFKNAMNEYGIKLLDQPQKEKYDAIVIAVSHDIFKELSINKITSFCKPKHILYDVKSIINIKEVDGRL
jgi:UDP-N-acetyl-D-galactosamine dehydrogenase